MAINTTWSVDNMTRVDADGGVILAYWSLTAASDAGGGEMAQEGGKARFTYDASSSDYIAYADLKESDVLGWIYDQNKGPSTGGPEDETAAEYKARIEAERTAKVQAQIDRNATQATGVPW
jgi:hypothetical protein|tara:strand:+ start:366 stop:728 length:363 start_codon:yes stop_codon:yes gene_type:complete